jgi:hypothetical protein
MPVRKLFRRPVSDGSLLHWLHTFVLHVMTGFLAVAAYYASMYGLLRTGMTGVFVIPAVPSPAPSRASRFRIGISSSPRAASASRASALRWS